MLLDRLKAMTSLVINVPSDIEKVSVIIEQKAATAAAAVKNEAIALEKAITPEVEAEIEKLEGLLKHIPGLSEIVKAHTVLETVAERALHAVESVFEPAAAAAPAPSAPAVATSDAAPPVL